jgi:hypothetical protein
MVLRHTWRIVTPAPLQALHRRQDGCGRGARMPYAAHRRAVPHASVAYDSGAVVTEACPDRGDVVGRSFEESHRRARRGAGAYSRTYVSTAHGRGGLRPPPRIEHGPERKRQTKHRKAFVLRPVLDSCARSAAMRSTAYAGEKAAGDRGTLGPLLPCDLCD